MRPKHVRDQILLNASDKTIEAAANAYAWICALETTDYKQGDFMLGSPSQGFCCIGLGHHLLVKEIADNSPVRRCQYSPKFSTEVGLSDVGHARLAILNDSRKLTFPQIAQRVRDEPHEYFRTDVALVVGVFLEEEL